MKYNISWDIEKNWIENLQSMAIAFDDRELAYGKTDMSGIFAHTINYTLKQIVSLREELSWTQQKYGNKIAELQEGISRRESIIKDQSAEILKKNEQIHRRNLQIADLKKSIGKEVVRCIKAMALLADISFEEAENAYKGYSARGEI